ncbi:MAG: efflux transporter outer membrane subunit [Acidobacteriota bacterium]|nr:efflux transporter outer membrane subunit [Acidobacteriota bacterium]
MILRPSILSAGGLALALAGACTAVRPPLPAPPEPPSTWTALTFETAPVPEDWIVSLGSAELARLVTEATDRNHDLGAAAARIEQAVALARIAGADRQPQISAGLNGRRQRSAFFGLPLPGSRQGVFAVHTTTWGASLDVSWEADLWGRLRAAHQATLADHQAARALFEGARLSLAAQTAKAWLAVVAGREQLDLARRIQRTHQQSLEAAERRYRAGRITISQVRVRRSALAAADATVAAAERQVDAARRQLEVLTGRYPAGSLAPTEALPEVPGPVPAGLPAEILSRRPDLRAAEWQLEAADARLRQAHRARYPRLNLTASGGSASPDLGHLLDSDFKVWSLATGVLAPLFQGGRLAAGEDLAFARAREAAEAFAQALLRAFAEVETLLAAEPRLRAEESQAEVILRQAQADARLAERRYREGLTALPDLLDARQQVFTARSRWIGARQARLTHRIDLHLALGGGFLRPATDDPTEVSSR